MTDAARIFHEATNHWPDGRRSPRRLEFARNPPDNVPITFKEYDGSPVVELPLHALLQATRPGA